MPELTITAVVRVTDLPHPYSACTIVICDKCKEECWQDSRTLCIPPERTEIKLCMSCIGEAARHFQKREARA